MVMGCLSGHQCVRGFDAGRILHCEEQRAAESGALRGVSLSPSVFTICLFLSVECSCPPPCCVCVLQCVHRPAAGWRAEATCLPITVRPIFHTCVVFFIERCGWLVFTLSSIENIGTVPIFAGISLVESDMNVVKKPCDRTCSVCSGSPVADRKWSSWWGWWTTCCWKLVWMSAQRSWRTSHKWGDKSFQFNWWITIHLTDTYPIQKRC